MTFDSTYAFDLLHRNGVELHPVQKQLLQDYATLLLHWNAKVNLISRKDEEAVWRNHILHSLAGLTKFTITDGARVLDVGTGGGLPGIPLAIVHPDADFVLADSIAKKVRAVQDMADALGLQNVTTFTGRVEDAPIRRMARFNVIVTRAVAGLHKLVDWCVPIAATGAHLYAWKGGNLETEIADAVASRPGLSVVQHALTLTGEDYFLSEEKCLVEVQL